MKFQDIWELLKYTENSVKVIEKEIYLNNLNKVYLKNTLENFRSVLEYSAQIIKSNISGLSAKQVEAKTYFPYGKSREAFKIAVDKNLPTIESRNPDAYLIISDIQPFNSGKKWLIDLCALSNPVKHQQLSPVKTIPTKAIYQGGIFMAEARSGSSIRISGNVINGVLQDTVTYSGKANANVIVTPVGKGNTLIVEKNHILFETNKINVGLFVRQCHEELTNLTQKLQAIYPLQR